MSTPLNVAIKCSYKVPNNDIQICVVLILGNTLVLWKQII